MKNRQLAKAIAALFALMDNCDVPMLAETDAALEQAAVGLWNSMTCHRDEMAVYLWQAGWSPERACEYANKLPIREFWLKVQEMTGERIEVDSGLGESYTVEIEVDA